MAPTRTSIWAASLLILSTTISALPSDATVPSLHHNNLDPRGNYPSNLQPPQGHYDGRYRYQGCYTDSRAVKSLTGKVTRDPHMTLEKCAYECKEYPFFGTEYGTQCFCGTELERSARRRPQSECVQRCGGNPYQICGDADRLSVYANGDSTRADNLEYVGGFKFAGCWSDSVATRSLQGNMRTDGKMTVELCARVCQGSKYMGLEYGSQCFCGNHLGGHAVHKDECGYLCVGNKREICGGSARLSLYSVSQH
ncbi:WSC domain-containing protein [Podospora aff. communis PSN243]|uniref:WSC domain-containing protein n=1 Tax=Podospora aff. communis PSN243 TaxID=3040156 RepID=A0AAV9GEB7_9PEZI|nr:WSC domain-containing protein [Podospora aff. communis PSN243]